MSKNHLSVNKTTLLVLLLSLLTILVLVGNLIILVPSIRDVFTPLPDVSGRTLINTQTVNQAIDILNQ